MAIRIANIWDTRFHRKGVPKDRDTKGWMFYISRPTLEKLRKTGTDGARYYELLKETVKNFLNDHTLPQNSQSYDGDFFIQTKLSKQSPGHFATIAYPFDISSEVDNKYGVVLHLGDGGGEAEEGVLKLDKITGRSEYYSMFDSRLDALLNEEKELKGAGSMVYPPGLSGKAGAKIDPMWKEFSQAKLLPTDQLLDPDIKQGDFRNIISHQYIEVRLNRFQTTQGDRVSSKEQLLAIEKFESHESGYVNFAGAPGTGKSTLLHMITAHELFKNFGGGDSKILYYVPIQFLADEAKREIHSILQQIYAPPLKYNGKNAKPLLEQSRKNLSVVTIEAMTGGLIPGRRFNISRQKSEQTLLQELRLNEGQKKRVKQMRDGLRRVVFGVFGDFRSFAAWYETQRKQLEKNWKGTPLLLSDPERMASRNHKFTLNDFFSWDKDDREIKQFINDLNNITLYDGRGTDQFWDHATNIHHLSKLGQHGPGTTWFEQEGSIDYIVIDEVQDISITEVRALLNHFGNRKAGKPLRPFRFITAGDENQDIRDLVYVPENRHFSALYNDWVQGLKLQSLTQGGFQLSHGLNPVESIPLVSGYRVFNEMVDFANDIMKLIYDEYQSGEEAKKGRQGRMEVTQYGRNGIFIHCKEGLSKDDEKDIFHYTNEILGQLRAQLEEAENSNVTVQVAVTYDQADFNPDGIDLGNGKHPFFSRLRDKKGELINDYFNAQLDDMLAAFTEKFIQQLGDAEPNMVEQELRNELRLRGVMDVDAIKGLTMPMTVVIPPKELKKGIDQLSKDHLTKFLVQITRAQYVCIIVDDTRKLRESEAIIENITGSPTDWIDNILNNSAGFDPSFQSLFNATMREYNSKTLWERLEREAKSISVKLQNYVKWLRGFLTKLNAHPLTLKQLKDDFIQVKGERIDFKGVEKPEDIEIDFMLNPQLTAKLLPAVVVFTSANAHLRTVDEHGSSNVTEQEVNQAMVWWNNHNGAESESEDEQNVHHWFSLLTNPEPLRLVPPARWVNFANGKTATSEPNDPAFTRIEAKQVRLKGTTRSGQPYPIRDHVFADLHGLYEGWLAEDLDETLVEAIPADDTGRYEIHLLAKGEKLDTAKAHVELWRNSLMDVDYGIPGIRIDLKEDKFQQGDEKGTLYVVTQTEDPNRIRKQVRQLFHYDGLFEWPQTYTVRLPMGGWNIRSLQQVDENNELANLREMAWMEDRSSLFTIDPSVLSLALDSHSPMLIGRSMLKIYIGITSLKPAIFVDGFASALQHASEEEKRFILSWFTKVFYSDAMAERGAFREEVRRRIEEAFETQETLREVFSSFLSESPTIEDFQQRLDAMAFRNWSVALPKGVAKSMFQHTCLRLAFERVEPPIKIARLKKEVNRLEREENEALRKINLKEEEIKSLKEDLFSWISDHHEWTDQYPSLRGLNKRQKQSQLVEMEASKTLGTQPFPRGSPEQQWYRRHKRILDEEKNLGSSKDALGLKRAELAKKSRDLDAARSAGQEHLPPNPFQRGKSIHAFFDALLPENKNKNDSQGERDDQHRMWFTLLWGLPAFFNGNFELKEFGTNTLILPSKKIAGTLEQIQILLEAYCPQNNSTRIDAVFNELNQISQPKMFANKQFVDHQWVLGLMKMLESMVKQSEWSKAFTDTFYKTFRERMKRELQPLMLKHLLNVAPNSDTILDPTNLRNYLSSSFARLVYASWTHEYITDTNQDMVPLWQDLDVEEKDDWRARVDQESYKQLPVLHHRWAGQVEQLDVIPFTNAASFRAFACLAGNNADKATVEFDAAGLANHSAALKLTNIQIANDTSWYDFVETVHALCGREFQLLEWSLLDSYKHAPELKNKEDGFTQDLEAIAEKLQQETADYNYGIGPSLKQILLQIDDKKTKRQISLNSEYHFSSNRPIPAIELSVQGKEVKFDSSTDRWEVSPSLPLGLTLTRGSTIEGTPRKASPSTTYSVKLMRQGKARQREILVQPVIISVDQPPTDLTISKRKGDPKRWMLRLFDHAQRVHHFTDLHQQLGELMKEQRAKQLGPYRDGIKQLAEHNKEHHRLFWSEKEQNSNAGVFNWRWKKRGFEPATSSPNFARKNVVYNFLLAVLTESSLEKEEFQEQIEKLTAVSGATIGFLMPERAELEIDETKEKLDNEKKYEHAKDDFIQSILLLQATYQSTQHNSLERLAKDIKNELDQENFSEAMGRVIDAEWLDHLDHGKMKKWIEELEKAWDEMNE